MAAVGDMELPLVAAPYCSFSYEPLGVVEDTLQAVYCLGFERIDFVVGISR